MAKEVKQMVKKGDMVKYLESNRWVHGTYLEPTKGGKSKIMTQRGIQELPSWKIDIGGKKAKEFPKPKITGKPFWKM